MNMTELPFEVPEESPNPVGPSVREAILAVLASRDREFTTKEVTDLLHTHYGMGKEAVRGNLWKSSKDGLVTRVRHGVYRAKKETSDD